MRFPALPSRSQVVRKEFEQLGNDVVVGCRAATGKLGRRDFIAGRLSLFTGHWGYWKPIVVGLRNRYRGDCRTRIAKSLNKYHGLASWGNDRVRHPPRQKPRYLCPQVWCRHATEAHRGLANIVERRRFKIRARKLGRCS